jgi:predicted dinucleotide-binding enzyme
MRIGIIGAGHIGSTLARRFVDAGHEVGLANSRGPDSLRELVRSLGPRACAMTVHEAAQFGDVVVVSIPFGRYREIPTGGLDDKVVIDTNNYYPDRDGRFAELDTDQTTSSELLAAHLPGARVVKAFNSLYARSLAERGRPAGAPDRVAIPISGDDDEAKQMVAALIDEIGFDAIDAGRLAEGRRHQPGTPAYAVSVSAGELRRRLGQSAEPQPTQPAP